MVMVASRISSQLKRDIAAKWDDSPGYEARSDMGNGYRVILADDHVLVRHGLRRILEEKSTLEVSAEVGDGLDCLNVLQKINPDLIILDVSMPNLRGIEAIPEMPHPAECESSHADDQRKRIISTRPSPQGRTVIC